MSERTGFANDCMAMFSRDEKEKLITFTKDAQPAGIGEEEVELTD